LVFNVPAYGLGLPIAGKARPDDGWLDLFVFQRPGVLNLARYLGAVLCRCHERLPDVQHRRVRRVHLRADGPVPVQADGDPAGFLPVTVEVVPAAWRLLAPP
jgi:diacylglycerol kinase family enzyme